MKNLKNVLNNPDQASMLWALWIWNKAISEGEMLKQLNSFIESGFGGVAIRPTRDIIPSYLSKEFFHLFKRVLIVAKTNNIKVRIADDFSIPWSGFFQAEAEQNSSFRAQKLVLEHSCIVASKDVFEYNVPDKHSYVILAVKNINGIIDPNTVKNLQIGSKTSALSWKAPAGEWQVMVFKKTWYLDPLGYYVPNVFNPKVAQLYIQNVIEKFKTAFSKYIPLTLEGFICEMPTYLPSENGIPWDDDLIIKYKSRYKKNLIDILPSLFFNVDDFFAKNRSHVYNFILQAMYERFPVVLETWAKKHRISQWVICPERDINWSENILKDVMAIPSAHLASTGVQNQDGTDKDYGVVRAMADMNSIEHRRETIAVVGRNRKGAGATLQSIKTEIDQHSFIETSKIILDGCYFNLDQRSYIKTPFNPAWYHPDWDQMKHLCDYTARILTFSRNLQRSRPVAVVMPSSSVMADYLPSNDESVRKGMHIFRKVIDDLQAKNTEFDVISEQFLISCTIKANGEFGTATRVRKGSYQAVIFPFSRLINNSTFVFLEKLAVKKGTIVFIDEIPQGNFDDGQSASFTARVTKLNRPKNQTVHVVSVNDFLSKLSHIENVVEVNVAGKPCSDIYATHGFGEGYEIYFFHNNSLKHDYFATIKFPEANHVYFVDFREGEFYEIENVEKTDSVCIIELDFSPKQTSVLLLSSVKIPGLNSKKGKNHPINLFGTKSRNYRVVLKDRWLFSPDTFNALPLASWNARIGLSRDTGGYSHYYEAYFETEEVPETCLLALYGLKSNSRVIQDTIKDFEVSINGITIKLYQAKPAGEGVETDTAIESFCGAAALKYNIKEAVMKGINRVSIRTIGLVNDPKTIFYPPIIAGYFSIKKGLRGWTMDTRKTDANYGSWTKHGFPYLCGSGVYQQVFEVPADYNRIVLRFNQVSGSVSPEINGISFGVINWQPITIDVTDAVEPRRNVLNVKIKNTLDNLLRMNGRASGLTGEVFLDIY